MFQTRCEYSKHVTNVSNGLRIFKTGFKCLQRVANNYNALKMFQTRCKYSKKVVNVSNALRIFKTRGESFKRVADI